MINSLLAIVFSYFLEVLSANFMQQIHFCTFT